MPRRLHYSAMLLIIFLVNWGCKKNAAHSDAAPSAGTLSGSWELRMYVGGFGITGGGQYPPGNGQIVNFSDSTYAYYRSGRVTQSGHYVVVQDNTASESTCMNLPNGLFTARIVYDGDYPGIKRFFQVENDTLIIRDGCIAADGISEEFVRIGNPGN